MEDAQLPIPENLRSLSEVEVARLGRKAVFKLDCTLMPCLTTMFIMNYLDRQNIASAKLNDIDVDLGLSSVQYQTSVSILFVGYILMQVPSNIIVGKIKQPAYYICAAMGVWGIISTLMMLVHNFVGIVICRFFLGFAEAVFFPGALYYMSLFYNRKQYALRSAILFSGSQLGNAFGGLLAIAIFDLDDVNGIEGWRWLFLIEGCVTIAFAILFVVVLPNSIRHLHGFTEQEKDWIIWNYEADLGRQRGKEEANGREGLMLAVKDPKMWLLMALLTSIYIAAGVVNFFPSVVSGLGYSRNVTLGLTAPPFVLSIICMLINGYFSDRRGKRYIHIVCPLAVGVAANIIAVSTLNIAARYAAMMLMPGSIYAAVVVVLSWITGTLNQPALKRAASIAAINAVANSVNIWTSYLYRSAPRYLPAFLTNLAAMALAVCIATATRVYLSRENAKMDRGEDLGRNGPTESQKSAGYRHMT
ncbi:unnamed protein product [Clonostachys rosea f. rosea IK726]|nr:unnamed protein product [Clonostachys rosea f. rosea IK726]